jgi:TonB-linked SusC/RagA family outer membrane protein
MHNRWLKLVGRGLLGLALALSAGTAWAQERAPATIHGRLINDRGEPAPGVAVYVTELSLVTTSRPDGSYAILVPGERVRGQQVTVRTRGIGFRPAQPQQIALNPGRIEVNFTVVVDMFLLEALVVTGVTAETEQIKVPFNVDRINVEALPVPASDPLSQLKGKVAGANIVSHSGRPGSSPAPLLRGPRSINAAGRSQEPLYVLDGVIVYGSLPDINPLDISSVEVVKGAAAASLFGAQGANGVIQITTKSGRHAEEGVRFHVRSEAGTSDIERDFGIATRHSLVMDETGRRFCQTVSGQPLCARTFDYLDAQAALNNTPGVNVPASPQFPVDPGASFANRSLLKERFQVEKWPHQTYNAVDVAVDPRVYTQNSMDLTGRLGGTSFFASASMLNQPGAIRFLEGYRRTSLRLNVDQQVGNAWQVGVRTYYSHADEDGEQQEGGGRSFFRLTRAPAIVNPLARDTLGRLYVKPNLQNGGLQNENPLYWLENDQRVDVSDRFLGGAEVRYQPIDWLNVSGDFNFDINRNHWDRFRDKGFRDNFNNTTTQGGFIQQASNGRDALNTGLNVTTTHRVGSLVIRPSLRYLYQQTDFQSRELSGGVLAVQGVKDASNATINQTIESGLQQIRSISGAGAVDFDFKDRYILSGLVRRDGWSLFGAENRWDTYGRLSAAWRLALEPWWFIDPVSEFKLRASYGTAGGVPSFAAQYETFNIAAGGVVSFGNLGNRNLRPEKSYEIEVGADVELFRRALLSVTYARSATKDQIDQVRVPVATGFGTQWQNIGTLENKTWELSLDIPIVRSSNFSWNTRFIYDRTRTTVTELTVPPYNFGTPLQATGSMFRMEEGERYGTFYGRYFLRQCADLPAAFQSQCGANGAFQLNDDGFVVWVGDGNSWRDGITRNLWEAELPGGQAPYGDLIHWGMPIVMRDSIGAAAVVPLGNALPDFRFAITQDISWGRFSVYALLDASIGQDVWNQGLHWAQLDFISKNVDQQDKTLETAKPVGYYWRSPAPLATGVGGLYENLIPNNFSVESASYAKLRELAVSMRIGRIGGMGDWSVSLIGRNLFTITGYRGFDPEVGITGGQSGSAAINAVDAFTFPNTRSFTIGVATTF